MGTRNFNLKLRRKGYSNQNKNLQSKIFYVILSLTKKDKDL